MLEQDAGLHRDAPGPAVLMLDGSLCGSYNHQQALPIKRLVHEKAGARLETAGHRCRALVIAHHHDGSYAVAIGVAHLPREFRAVGKWHLVVDEDHGELPMLKNVCGLYTFRYAERV